MITSVVKNKVRHVELNRTERVKVCKSSEETHTHTHTGSVRSVYLALSVSCIGVKRVSDRGRRK